MHLSGLRLPEALIDDLLTVNDYYATERYPGPRYTIPDKTEIENNLSVAMRLYEKVMKYISST
jgi:HEPN domain-containing protein